MHRKEGKEGGREGGREVEIFTNAIRTWDLSCGCY